jgi:hypothetical protein
MGDGGVVDVGRCGRRIVHAQVAAHVHDWAGGWAVWKKGGLQLESGSI